jgi:glutamate N-acetyltransferase/amino-acid N-acetyltransferase
MAVGKVNFPQMYAVPGIKLGTTCAGIKQAVHDDLLLIKMAEGATCAAVFTQNAFCAAPVVVARAHLQKKTRFVPNLIPGTAYICGKFTLPTAILFSPINLL